MNYGKIEETLHCLQQIGENVKKARILLSEILGEHDASEDVAGYKRSLFRFVQNDVVSFPFVSRETGKEKSEVGTSDTQKQGFVNFTEKEISQMPAHFKRLIIIQKKRCRIRVHQSGQNSTTYEIRYRSDGYNVSACGKTIELAKANFIKKLKTARPQTDTMATVPTTLEEFTTYYFEKFRKPKLAEQTYYNDESRLRTHIFPAFGKMRLDKITPNHCQTLYDNLRAIGKSKTADEVYSLLSIIFKGAIAHGILERNPLNVVVHFKHETKTGKALTKDEEKSMLEALRGNPLEIVYVLALYTGLRPNELKTAKIDGPFIVAVNSKRKKKTVEYKRIYICKRLSAYLDGVTEFPVYHEKYLSNEFSKYCPNHQMKDLRKTFNSRCKELGVSEHARMHFIGHALSALEATYTELSNEYLIKEGKKLNKW